ncbi:MAG: FAD-binding oxidoreductase [bacterium]
MGSSKLLPVDHLRKVEGWGGAVSSFGYVYSPKSTEELLEVIAIARKHDRKITIRGAGRSYGDAATGAENIILDTSGMNTVLSWNLEKGVITVECGVTIEQLWKHCIEDGWWPPVVPGTMYPTVGGCIGMNIHGKNNFKVGPFGDHVVSFTMVLVSGEIINVSRESDAELFHAVIGGFGMFGIVVSITLQMKKVYSGLLRVQAWTTTDLHALFDLYKEQIPKSDYLVGWVDCLSSGKKLGRSIVHQANYFAEGEDPTPTATLRIDRQSLPEKILGVFPKSLVWMLLLPFMNNVGMKFINWLRIVASKLPLLGKPQYEQSHAEFAFLLDYVPGWKKAYGDGGLIQYQSFIPKEHAEKVFASQIEMCQRAGIPPYLGVFKQHKPDAFLFTHAVDGFSLALDFKVTDANRGNLWKLCSEMNDLVLKHNGRFYFAKDATLRPSDFQAFLGDDVIQKFKSLKEKYDPSGLLQTDLSQRLMRL